MILRLAPLLVAAALLASGCSTQRAGDPAPDQAHSRQTLQFFGLRPDMTVVEAWPGSGEYTQILGGTYPRREEDAAAKMSDAAKQAADSYTEAFKTSQDALGKLVHDVGGFFGSAKLWLDEQLRRNRDE